MYHMKINIFHVPLMCNIYASAIFHAEWQHKKLFVPMNSTSQPSTETKASIAGVQPSSLRWVQQIKDWKHLTEMWPARSDRIQMRKWSNLHRKTIYLYILVYIYIYVYDLFTRKYKKSYNVPNSKPTYHNVPLQPQHLNAPRMRGHTFGESFSPPAPSVPEDCHATGWSVGCTHWATYL